MGSYSGVIENGLNLNHSFDRVYYHAKIDHHDTMIDERNNAYKEFEKTTKTRLVFNIIVNSNVKIEKNEFAPGELEANFPLPKGTIHEGYKNVIVGYNKEVRRITDDQKKQIQKKIFETLHKDIKKTEYIEGTKQDLLNILDDEVIFNENIKKIQEIKEAGYNYNINPNPEQLAMLWKDTFGWNIETVEKELKGGKHLILSLDDKDGNIVSAGMLAEHGESTEWITNPNFQGKGMIQPLLFVLHNYGIKKMKDKGIVYPITAEARFDRSVSPGKKIGMKIYGINTSTGGIPTEENIGVHQNHVTIGGDSNPDSRNIDKEVINGLKIEELRSFVTMVLPEYYYQDEQINEILEIANI